MRHHRLSTPCPLCKEMQPGKVVVSLRYNTKSRTTQHADPVGTATATSPAISTPSPATAAGVMIAASTWWPRQPSFEGTNATDQTSTAPAARTPCPAREMVRQPFFSKEGDASTAAASLLLLLAGDVDTKPGPSCYACGQNFRQSDTPLNCHAHDCGV